MKRATVTIPDELEAKLEAYIQRQEVPPAWTTVMQAALREFLERRERFGGRAFQAASGPLRITPAEKGSGVSDVSINHDRYFAEDAYDDSFNEK